VNLEYHNNTDKILSKLQILTIAKQYFV